MAQALLIDVVNQSVTSITINNLTDSIATIGNGCTSTDAFRLSNGDYLLYDMSALFRPNPLGGFTYHPMNWLLMNKAIVIGWDESQGTLEDCLSSESEIQSLTTWYDTAYCEQAQK